MNQSILTSEPPRQYSWLVHLVKDFGVPIAILIAVTIWLAIRVEGNLLDLSHKIDVHKQFLQQICVNTAPDWERQKACWGIY